MSIQTALYQGPAHNFLSITLEALCHELGSQTTQLFPRKWKNRQIDQNLLSFPIFTSVIRVTLGSSEG